MSVGKNGVISEQAFSQALASHYDPMFYAEPDGTVWVRIFHHNNPASYLFATTDSFTTSVYKDANRWFNVSLCNLVSGSWELMIKQTATAGATEVKYRWVQKTNPMTATFADIAAANITRNTSTGYTNFSWGGLYKMASGSTYLCANNGTNGNWWGAVGACSNYQGGIPAWGGIVVTTGYEDVYLRIDNVTNSKATKTKVGFNATDFVEI